MYKNILIPMALERNRDIGVSIAVAHSLLDDGGQITALHVIEALPEFTSMHLPDNYQDKRESEAMALLKDRLSGNNDIKSVLVTGHAGRTILDFAEKHDNDVIIMASHKPGIQDYFLGSTAAWVVRHGKCSVHVIR